jgi:hypothetical protein
LKATAPGYASSTSVPGDCSDGLPSLSPPPTSARAATEVVAELALVCLVGHELRDERLDPTLTLFGVPFTRLSSAAACLCARLAVVFSAL